MIANGRYEELGEPQYAKERAHARKLLEKRPQWWRTPMAERQLKSGTDLIPTLFFRIRIDSMTGLNSAEEAPEH